MLSQSNIYLCLNCNLKTNFFSKMGDDFNLITKECTKLLTIKNLL